MRRVNIICIILSVLLVGGLAFLFYHNQQETNAKEKTLQALREEAQPYEQELQNLKSELENLKDDTSYTSEAAEIMVGFVAADAADLSYMESVEEAYDIPPVLILDCTLEQNVMEEILAAADASWEIMLFAPSFSEEVNESVLSVLSYLESVGREHTGVFLLRLDYTSDANIQLLKDDGFIGYTSYHSNSVVGQAEDGTVYFEYAYLTTPAATTVASRITEIYNSKTSIIIAFDMGSVHSGSMTEDDVTETINTLQSYAEMENCSFSTVADVVAELSTIYSIEMENQISYEEQAAEIQGRIDELNEIIAGIYDRYEAS